MRRAVASEQADLSFEMPPHFVIAERRMAGRALDRWHAGDRGRVSGFDDNSLVIVDPAGLAIIGSAGPSIAATFGLTAGMRLDGRAGLAAEVRAACDLIAFEPQPLPFEVSLGTPACGLMLVRGIALPIESDDRAAEFGKTADCVQFIVNWREVLNRAAMTRLRQELGAALLFSQPVLAKIDPFSAETCR